jgi:ribonuclease P protein component
VKGVSSDGVTTSPPCAGSDVGLRRSERVRRHLDYQRIYDRGTKVHSKFFTLFTLANTFQYGRLGIAATRKLGGAVVRNRAKRLIREAFRRNKIAPGMDVVVIPRREMLDASPTVIETELRHIIERGLRQRRRPD